MGKKIQQGKIHVEHHAEPDGQAPSVRRLEEQVVDPHDPDRATEMLGFDVAARGQNG